MVWFYIGVLIVSFIMATIKSPIKWKDKFPPKFKWPEVNCVRDFPDGWGSFASSTCQSKCEEGDGTNHGQNASTVNKVEALSVPHSIDNREKVKAALNLLQKTLNELPSNSSRNRSSKAARILSERENWINVPKQLGPIPGVQVGDKFQCYAELKVSGLHHQLFRGIDYMEKNGKILATSVVASSRYENELNELISGTLIYCGEGGNPSVGGSKKPIYQNLKRGNRALLNSKEAGEPVRVILGFKISKTCSHMGLGGGKLKNTGYVYDGLYSVDECLKERGEYGTFVYKFRLKRVLGQPKLDYGELMTKLNWTSSMKQKRYKMERKKQK